MSDAPTHMDEMAGAGVDPGALAAAHAQVAHDSTTTHSPNVADPLDVSASSPGVTIIEPDTGVNGPDPLDVSGSQPAGVSESEPRG